MRHFFIATLVAALLAGCGGGGGSQGGSQGGAKLSISSTDAGVRSALKGHTALKDVSVDFDLGEVGFTREYLFLLENSGTQDATNVVLSSTHPGVVVTPSTIRVIPPASAGGVRPIVQVTVVHGLDPSGIGEADILAPERITFQVSATSDQTSTTASMGVTPLVANYTLETESHGWELHDGFWSPPEFPGVVWEDRIGISYGYQGYDYYVAPSTTEFPHVQEVPPDTSTLVPAQIFRFTNTGNSTLHVYPRWDMYNSGYNPMVHGWNMAPIHVLPGEAVWLPAWMRTHGPDLEAFGTVLEIRSGACLAALFGPYRTGVHLIHREAYYQKATPQ